MSNVWDLLEKVIAVGGVLLCLIAGVARLSGHFYVLNIEAMTIFTVGIGVMVSAALLKLHLPS